ncbi:MAG: putative metal-binding motif-containing protein [Alphaproteobacteria bacterium]|nr:putative metal-binding motif-containing protein [Alphaproteobacteria bacterium]MCB9795795.1 putative metal-binding motif-containing protein [Alphaproteobacteria bacterium]
MRTPSLLLGVLALALGCGEKEPAGDSDAPTDDTSEPNDDSADDTGETQPPQDQDRDGFYSDEDCDDNDYRIFPGAPELCEGEDNDCDDLIDEDFDADGDGHLIQDSDCDAVGGGTDCDDTTADVSPDAEEIPYDGVDQDCDGEDLEDVDGDGFRATEVGGSDCDDSDASIHPGAEDIPLDEIDQDCDGADDSDGDGDGYNAESVGGDDCDDSDPSVHPGALDLSFDGLDADCDGRDGATFTLTSSPTYIEGTGSSTDLVGRGLDLCDFDEDGLADLVVAAPFYGGTSYTSAVGIWYGSGWSTWSAGMSMTSADVRIEGNNNYEFFGFESLCGDFDGDGHQDLVLGRGEIDYAALNIDTDYSLLVFYGDGLGFDASLSDADADAELTIEMDPTDAGTVYSAPLSVGDINGDGSDDILIALGSSAAALFDGEERVLVLPGAAWSGPVSLADELSHVLVPDQPYEFTEASVLSDLDGDGHADVAVLSNSYTSDYGDSRDTSTDYEGRVFFVGDLSSPSAEDLDVGEAAYATQVGSVYRQLYGLRLIEGDFTGDGVEDLVISSLGDSPNGRRNAGGLYLFESAAVDLTGPGLDAAALSDADAFGEIDYAYLGYALAAAGDVDGDGAEDFYATGPGSGLSNVGEIYLVSGSLFTGSIADMQDVALLTWRGNSSDSFNGYDVASGADIDGDGINDAAFVASGWDSAGSSTSSGRVYIFLSSSP